MKSAILLALLLWQATPGPETTSPQYFRYQRVLAPSDPGQNCAIIDPHLFPHAAPSLKDLRLFKDNHEVPYAITLSEPQQPDSDTATIRNLGLRGRKIVFDLEMPNRPYTEIDLGLAGHNFLATATVSGTRDPDSADQTRLGDFTLFDLSRQHLSRNTTIHLQETSLPLSPHRTCCLSSRRYELHDFNARSAAKDGARRHRTSQPRGPDLSTRPQPAQTTTQRGTPEHRHLRTPRANPH